MPNLSEAGRGPADMGLTYDELLRAYEQEKGTVAYLLTKLHEAQSRAQAAEARAARLEEQLEGMIQPAMEE